MNLEDIYMKARWCGELLKEIDEIKEAKYPDLYIDTGSYLNVALAVLEQVKKDLKIKKKKDIESVITEVIREREQRKQEVINNATNWFKITCPKCNTTFECRENRYGTHCYDYLTKGGKEIVGSLDTQTLECPICNKYFKDPTLKHEEDC